MDRFTTIEPVWINDAGEWWKANTEAVIKQALQSGAGPNVSDAYTINGFPGPFYNCSSKGGTKNSNLILTFFFSFHIIIYIN